MFYYRRMRFPQGKVKALTLSYDDDTIHDLRFAEIINRYGLKCTFNLNFGRFSDGVQHLSAMTLQQAKDLLMDSPHEVAVHGYTHMPLRDVPCNVANQDVSTDVAAAENAFGRIVRGMAYANGSFNEETGSVLAPCGIEYCRTVRATRSFALPKNWLYLDPTCHHKDPELFSLAEKFLNDTPKGDPYLFYLWGHAYEFNNDNNWDLLERFCQTVGNREDVWYATNIEIFDYIRDYNRLIFSFDGSWVHNPTAQEIFFSVGERAGTYNYAVKPGETVFIDRTLPEKKG